MATGRPTGRWNVDGPVEAPALAGSRRRWTADDLSASLRGGPFDRALLAVHADHFEHGTAAGAGAWRAHLPATAEFLVQAVDSDGDVATGSRRLGGCGPDRGAPIFMPHAPRAGG